jgi:hypothetical protein
MSSVTRITLAILIMLGSCFLMSFGIVRGLIVRANLNNPEVGNVLEGTPGGQLPILNSTPVDMVTPVFPATATPESPIAPIATPAAATPDALQTVGNAFLSAVQLDDYATAFALLDGETRAALASPDNLRILIAGISFNGLKGWQFTQQQQLSIDTSVLFGVVNLSSGLNSDVKLEMRLNGDQWRVKWFYNTL